MARKKSSSLLTRHVPISFLVYAVIALFVVIAFIAFQTNRNLSNTSQAAFGSGKAKFQWTTCEKKCGSEKSICMADCQHACESPIELLPKECATRKASCKEGCSVIHADCTDRCKQQ